MKLTSEINNVKYFNIQYYNSLCTYDTNCRLWILPHVLACYSAPSTKYSPLKFNAPVKMAFGHLSTCRCQQINLSLSLSLSLLFLGRWVLISVKEFLFFFIFSSIVSVHVVGFHIDGFSLLFWLYIIQGFDAEEYAFSCGHFMTNK